MKITSSEFCMRLLSILHNLDRDWSKNQNYGPILWSARPSLTAENRK